MSTILHICLVVSLGQLGQSVQVPPAPAAHPAAALPADSLENTALRIALNSRMAEISFQYSDFDQALHELASKGRINLNVDWAALREFKVFSDTPITISAKDIRLSRAIEIVLQIADGGRGILVFSIEDGILEITTRERIDSVLQTRVYDLGHLLGTKVDEHEQYELQRAVTALWLRHFHVFAPPWEWMPSHVHQPDSGFRKGPLVGPEHEINQILDELLKRLRPRREAELMTAIHDIATQSWASHGGAGTMVRFENKLIIKQSAQIHAEIEKLLAELEASGLNDKPAS